MSIITELTEQFAKLPGIGPRQARRFTYYLLTRPQQELAVLADLLTRVKQEIARCTFCGRFFAQDANARTYCAICADKHRDRRTLMVVEKDVDVDTVEAGGLYNGLYFILGGTIPILAKQPHEQIRLAQLEQILKRAKEENSIKEVILALSATPEGDNTAHYLSKTLTPIAEKHGIELSILGRGLSTGSELEYADPETIKNALENRR